MQDFSFRQSLLERWAGEQNAGNAFAEQVRYWALSRRAALTQSEATSGSGANPNQGGQSPTDIAGAGQEGC